MFIPDFLSFQVALAITDADLKSEMKNGVGFSDYEGATGKAGSCALR
jgi:hypothetical protein